MLYLQRERERERERERACLLIAVNRYMGYTYIMDLITQCYIFQSEIEEHVVLYLLNVLLILFSVYFSSFPNVWGDS